MNLSRISARLSAAATTSLLLGVSSIHAAAPPAITPNSADLDSTFDFVGFFTNGIGSVINVIFFLAGAAAIIYLIWAGIKYITAGGDTKKAGEARTAIINAVIGIAVIIGAYTLINIAFGINSTVKEIQTTEATFQ